MKCLKDLLQISELGCDCLDIDPENGSLYLDSDVEGRIPLSAAVTDCSDMDTVTMLNGMRDRAFEMFDQMLMARLQQNGSRYPDIVGKFPQKDSSNSVLNSDGFNYLIIKPKCVSGLTGVFNIEAENSEDVYLVKDGGDELITEPITLNSNTEYVFYFVPSGQILNKRIECGCSGMPQYKRYFDIGTGTIDQVGNIESGTKQYTYGFNVNFRVWCDPLIHLCDQKTGWKTNSWLLTYLYGVLFQWRKSFAYWIITSGKVTNYLTTNGEELPALIELYDAKIEERLNYLTRTYAGSDCLNCGSIAKGSILI